MKAFDGFSESNSISSSHEENQDSYLVDPESGLFAVADGLGGYRGGKEASSLAINALRALASRISQPADFTPIFVEIHERVLQEARRRGYFGMGTTLAVAKISRTEGQRSVLLLSANVGDSPVLVVRGRDRSVVEAYHDDSERSLDPLNLWSVTQYLGYDEARPEVHTVQLECEEGDAVLVCSDGVTDNLVAPGRNYSRLSGLVLERKSAQELVESALSSGVKSDDATAVLVYL